MEILKNWFELPGPVKNTHSYEPIGQEEDNELGKGSKIATLEEKPFYLQPYRKENVGLLYSYFCVGVALYITAAPTNYYLVQELNASSVQVGVLATVQSLPWSFKIFYGILSDTVPIMGYRRKPYYIIGWLVYILVSLYLAAIRKPSILATIFGNFVMACGLLLADVCTDTMCVERAKLEHADIKGSFQSKGYTIRSFGMGIGAVMGALLYNKATWGWGLTISQIYILNAIVPAVLVISTVTSLIELAPNNDNLNLNQQLADMWNLLQLRAVWRPMIFIFTYNVLQVPNSAWFSFLVEGLKFSNFELGLLTISSTFMTWAGMVVYKKFFFNTNWRHIYIMTTCLGVFFSSLQLLLIFGLNNRIGLPNIAFALGDQTIAAFVIAIQYMPSCIMYVVLCPDGSEGATYAMLTTIGNLAYTVASDLGSWMVEIWDVSNETLAAGDFTGMAKLTVLTSLLQISPIVLVYLLPASKEEQLELREKGDKSWWGGFWLAVTIIVSLLFTVGLNIYLLSSGSSSE